MAFARRAAADSGAYVHASLYERSDGDDGLGYNTAIIVAPDGRLVSLGLMGPRPGVSAFGAAPGLKALAVSNEAQGGSVQPTATPTVIGPLS